MRRYFINEDIDILVLVNKHRKSAYLPTSFTVRKMHIKTILAYHTTLMGAEEIENNDNTQG